jgi:hypothetical protein
MKLSKTQEKVLRILSEPDGELEYDKDAGEVWLFGRTIPDARIRMSTFNALRNRRLIKIYNRWPMPARNYYELTPAGRTALAEADVER